MGHKFSGGVHSGRRPVIALAGNPNVGKSTVFNALTGLDQHTGNWTGKTVEVARGQCTLGRRPVQIVDLPGTYSLAANSAEEEVARDFLRSGEADGVVVVCDATCLERNLNLVLQILEMGPPAVVCVNLMDEAKRKGIRIDLAALSRGLGVPVVGVTARNKGGLGELVRTVEKLTAAAAPGTGPEEVTAPPLDAPGEADEEARVAGRVARAQEICRTAVIYTKEDGDAWDRRLDRILTGKFTGLPLMLALLALVFWLTIAGANVPSAWLSDVLGRGEGVLSEACQSWGAPQWLQGVLVEGAYRVLTWVVSVMLPPMAIFFPLFTLLEDGGYLPRVAYNLDRPLQKCKACGKQALCMCMGFGCNTVGVMGCRIIDSPRERLLAILTNSMVPCNGRFPTLITLLTLFCTVGAASSLQGAVLLAGAVALGVAGTLAATALLSRTALKGTPSSYTLELPPYRRPQLGKAVVRSVCDRTVFVLGRAAAVAAPAGVVLWMLANTTVEGQSLLHHCADLLDPVARLIGLDGAILLAFLLGAPANEIVLPILLMTYLSQGSLVGPESVGQIKGLLEQNGWTALTAVNTAIFCLFHWPCTTTLLTIRKETGSWKWTALSAAVPTAFGVALCGLTALVWRLMG